MAIDPAAQIIASRASVALARLRDLNNVIDEITYPDDEVDQTQDDRDDRADLLRHLTIARQALRDLRRTATHIGETP